MGPHRARDSSSCDRVRVESTGNPQPATQRAAHVCGVNRIRTISSAEAAMSRYFSRLVARAAGAVVPALIAPGPRRDVSASTPDDPFEATAPLALTPPVPPPTPGLNVPLPSPAP